MVVRGDTIGMASGDALKGYSAEGLQRWERYRGIRSVCPTRMRFGSATALRLAS